MVHFDLVDDEIEFLVGEDGIDDDVWVKRTKRSSRQDDELEIKKTLTELQRGSVARMRETSMDIMRAISSTGMDSESDGNSDAAPNGFFIDYLYRMKGKKNHDNDISYLFDAFNTSPPDGEADRSDTGTANTMVIAVEAAAREKVIHFIMRDVTRFYKANEHSAWVSCPNPLKKLGLDIINIKRQAKCTRSEVGFAVSQKKLIHNLRQADKVTKESQDERTDRLRGFWAKFHEGPHRLDATRVVEIPRGRIRPASAPICRSFSASSLKPRAQSDVACPRETSLLPGSKAQRPRPPSAGSNPMRRTCTNNSQESAESASLWKSRPVRSRCSAGKWEWARGVSDAMREGQASPQKKKASQKGVSLMNMLTADTEASVKHVSSGQHKNSLVTASTIFPDQRKKLPRALCQIRQPKPMSASVPSLAAKQTSLSTDALRNLALLPGLGLSPNVGPRTGSSGTQGASPKSRRRREADCEASVSAGEPREDATGLSLDFTLGNCATELQETGKVSSKPRLAADAFNVPWRPGGSEPSWKAHSAPTKQYLRACDDIGCVPVPSTFASGHSLKLLASGRGLADADLAAFSVLAQNVPVETVDLQGNGKLSDGAICGFLESLRVGESSLRFLSLQRCTNAGATTLGAITRLLSDVHGGASLLETLDLSGIAISARAHLPLAQAVREHMTLRTVHLADTGLGGTSYTSQCIGDLLGNDSLRSLDLGWNCFGAKDFDYLGKRLIELASLQSLNLANCSSAGAGGSKELLGRGGSFLNSGSWREKPITPLAYFLEHLCHDHSLTSLDISLNRLDFRGALVVEDALENSKKMKKLIISHNPLGSIGMRSILRLLTRSTSALVQYECDDCFQGGMPDVNTDFQVFSSTNPGGRYQLDLSRPYHRSLLRMFYKTAERFALSPDVAFVETVMTPPPFVHATKDNHGVWQVPQNGRLSITFTVERAIETALKSLKSDWDFEGFLKAHFHLMRLSPGFNKVVPLLASWKLLEGHSTEQKVFLDALSKDFLLTMPQMQQLSQSRMVASEVIGKLIHCVVGGSFARYLSILLVPTLGDCIRTLKYIRNYLVFNCDNPTGRYKLDLANASDYAVAEQLVLLDNWEVSITKRQNRFDTSQHGNYSQVRNARYADQPLETHSIAHWVIPEFEILEFDYTSGRRPPDGQEVFDNDTFARILVTIQSSETSTTQQMQALRMCSHWIFVSSMQLRELLGLYRHTTGRADLFVLFFNRVVDMHNEKVFRVRFENDEEVQKLRERLGFAIYFPFMQPEQAQFGLDFSYHDQRLACNILVNLAAKEARSNMRDYSFKRGDGSIDPLLVGVPRSWDSFNKMPTVGYFKAKYVCAPEDRNFKCRKQFLDTYGAVTTNVKEEDVLWWCAMTEVPEDVLEYLEFLISNVPDVYTAFTIIDGVDGNGQITLREFEDGYYKMNCKKFAGARERERMHAVFRYLDPSGEGQISRQEWGVLELLWKEVKQSITEFVVFCQRTFGQDLKRTWRFLDEHDNGEIDEEEWVIRLGEIGYFGPARPVFGYLDKDDEGTVSLDEFQLLNSFKQDVSVYWVDD